MKAIEHNKAIVPPQLGGENSRDALNSDFVREVMTTTIERLQAWYAAQCNGDWEH
jgi:hypothetical protein